MIVIHTIRTMQEESERLRAAGQRIGFVPTMGYLHEGHLDLLRLAGRHADLVVMSIFVNPTQFAAGEDLDRYPRDFARDRELAAQAGCDIIFAPSAEEMYPDGDSSWIFVDEIGATLEGAFRPTHFRGVTTVVGKLFHIVRPHCAVFGQKDAQQAAIIRRMTRDLHFGIDIRVAPIRRENDGLAMSSRNTYLSKQERVEALALSRSLLAAESLFAEGERRSIALYRAVEAEICRSGGVQLDYIGIVDPDSFRPIEGEVGRKALIAVAARVGSTRLIDNIILGNEATQ
ncbi:MAG: pantoate--beta-alanine ligase [Bacteroidota bacterium]|nr:pantoate--beta-alanine ligase [Bacteroidota bacterium]